MYQEKDNIELKKELTDAVKKEIVAFLNTMNGTILVGVEDDGNVYKPFQEEDRDYIDTKVSNWLQDTIYPLPSHLVKYYFNGDGILIIEVNEGKDKPYYLREKGPKPAGVYKRVGRSIRKANEDEILRMIMSSKNYIYENDISEEQNISFDALTRAFNQSGMELTERNMVSLGIKNTQDIFTNLGFILSDQSDVTVKVAEYDKNRNFKLKKQFTGSLIDLFHHVKEQADRLNDVSAKIDFKSFKRKEIVSYPGASLREMILNAFVHADFFIRSNIKIEFFEDKCKITSPGGIFNASMEEIMKGTQTYRNHKLVNIFDKLGLIENFGTGIPRTFDAYKNEERQPIFEATENFFYVTLPNLNYLDDDQINDQINELDLNILSIIYKNPGIKVLAIQEKLLASDIKASENQIRNSIKRKIRDYIDYKGSKKTGGYYIKD
jgi:predicted HTH transcriptional regulator